MSLKEGLQTQLAEIATHFAVDGEFVGAERYGNGHINETYAATFRTGGGATRTIVQKINHGIFREPEKLIENAERATAHIRSKLEGVGVPDIERRVLTFVPTRDGRDYHRDAEGSYWRSYVFVEGAKTYEAATSPDLAFEAARAFGEFQAQLADLGGPRLHETIPDFHVTPKRLKALREAVDADDFGRAAGAAEEIAFVFDRADETGRIQGLLDSGALPERVTHNDTKLNNVLICERTGKAICVIDLDTVMPGSALYDFGDMVRTATSPSEEDELDLSKVQMRMPMFEALVAGYLEAAGDMLTPLERELLPFSGMLITLEIGIRFLTDHLCGDVYFRTHRENHNLDRCRTQFRLAESIERQMPDMERVARQR